LAALVAGTIAANQAWLDRHFLPSWFCRGPACADSDVRPIAIAALEHFVVVASRRRTTRARWPARTFNVSIAAVLALGASEWCCNAHVRLRAGWSR
jgi:hypothetical protein